MVSRETVSEKELYEYISEQDTLKEMLMGMGSGAVSYTHLTLPTILRV